MELGDKFSWKDIEAAARNSALLQAVVTRVDRGDLSREQALVGAVLVLQSQNDAFMQESIARLRMAPASLTSIPVSDEPVVTSRNLRKSNSAF